MVQVLTIGAGGSIATVGLYNGGLTQRPPTNPVPFTGGNGTGATFNLTFHVNAGGGHLDDQL